MAANVSLMGKQDIFWIIGSLVIGALASFLWGLKKRKCRKCGRLSYRSYMDDIYKCPEHGEWICNE